MNNLRHDKALDPRRGSLLRDSSVVRLPDGFLIVPLGW